MENINFLKQYGQEIILQSLAIANKKHEKLKEIGDLSGYELIEREFFPKYEKLLLAFSNDAELEKLSSDASSIKKILQEIMIKNNLTEDFIQEQILKRESLKGHSGSEVVKKLFQFEIQELNKKKSKLLMEADDILREEFRINEKLSNSIQQDEQIEIIYELQPLRKKFRTIDAELLEIEKKIQIREEKLSKKWYYLIYGTIEEKKLLESYNSIFNKESSIEQ